METRQDNLSMLLDFTNNYAEPCAKAALVPTSSSPPVQSHAQHFFLCRGEALFWALQWVGASTMTPTFRNRKCLEQ